MHMRTVLAATLLGVAATVSLSAQDDWPARRGYPRDGVHIRIARDYHLPADQIATWPIVVIGGSATIDGRVEDEVVVIGGPVRVGPTAQVRGNLTSVLGEVIVADGAEITGEIHDVSVLWPRIRFELRDWLWGVDRGWWAVASLMGNLLRLTLVMLAACFLSLVAPGWIRRIQRSAEIAPVAGGFLGVAVELMFVPLLALAVIGLVVTIIGIPLLLLVPFAVVAFLLMWLAGFAGVAAQIGGRFRGTVISGANDVPVLDTACGVALLGMLTVIGNVLAIGPSLFGPAAAAFGAAGVAIEYLAWTVGLGAALTAPFRHRWHTAPPPLRTAASATA
jgi:hypothetical protein